MSDEMNTESSGIQEPPTDDQIYAEAMAMLHPEGEQKEEATAKDQPEEEVKEETKEEPAEAEAEPQPEAVEEKKTETAEKTATPEAKLPYTPEEIKAIAATGDFSKFDTSRLTPGEQAAMKSMQAGLTPKLQRAAEIEKNYQYMLKEREEQAEKRAKEEAARLFEKEKEEYGEDLANYRKEVRELREAHELSERRYKEEREAAQRTLEAMAAQQFHMTFLEKAKDFGLPTTTDWEELILAKVTSENALRAKTGEPFMSIEDAMMITAKTTIPKDTDTLEALLNANPKLREALEAKFLEKHAKKRGVGPTVPKPSGGGKAETNPKPTATVTELVSDEDAINYAIQKIKELNG